MNDAAMTITIMVLLLLVVASLLREDVSYSSNCGVVSGYYMPTTLGRPTTARRRAILPCSSVSSSSLSVNHKSEQTHTENENPNKKDESEVVDFWGGTKLKTMNENANKSRRHIAVPCEPNLDPYDGPLPPGAYLLEGKTTPKENPFDAKPTCRITLGVQLVSSSSRSRSAADPEQIVRRLQSCLDAGLDTFHLGHDDDDDGDHKLEASAVFPIIQRMNQQTPAYVRRHWSLTRTVADLLGIAHDGAHAPQGKSVLPENTQSRHHHDDYFFVPSSLKADIRHSILELIERTGCDALDSLQVDCSCSNSNSNNNAITLEVLEQLTDLQEEGWIRSIGIRNNNNNNNNDNYHNHHGRQRRRGRRSSSEKLKQDIQTYFGTRIDFYQQEGNLFVPSPASSSWSSSFTGPASDPTTTTSLRLMNSLAGGLLTDRYCDATNPQHSGKSYRSTKKKTKTKTNIPYPSSLSKIEVDVLQQWSFARRQQREASSSSSHHPQHQPPLQVVWNEYQNDVIQPMQYIASKYDVTIMAVALRWALECGGDGSDNNNNNNRVSSAIADVVFDEPGDDTDTNADVRSFRRGAPTKLRQVFQFQLDDEDKDMLSKISPSATASTNKNYDEHNAGSYDDDDDDDDEYPDIDFNSPALWL